MFYNELTLEIRGSIFLIATSFDHNTLGSRYPNRGWGLGIQASSDKI